MTPAWRSSTAAWCSTGVLNMIMMSFIAIPLVTVTWLLLGYSIASPATPAAVCSATSALRHAWHRSNHRPRHRPGIAVRDVPVDLRDHHRRAHQRAIADRARFAAWVVFVPSGRSWSIRWWRTGSGPRRWLARLGVLDYAGGLVVETVSALPRWPWHWFLAPDRLQTGRDAAARSAFFVLLGVGLLWFGWFGFNAGSALAANGTAAAIFLNTLVAGCLGMLGWLTVEQVRDGKPTTFGAASECRRRPGRDHPSCGTVNTLGAVVVGLAAGVACSFAIGAKFRFGYDDSPMSWAFTSSAGSSASC